MFELYKNHVINQIRQKTLNLYIIHFILLEDLSKLINFFNGIEKNNIIFRGLLNHYINLD